MSKRKTLCLFKLLALTSLCALFACAAPLHAQTRHTRTRNATTPARNTITQATHAPTTSTMATTQQTNAPASSSSDPTPAPSPSVPEEDADLVIIANVQAKELRFETVPNPTVEFPGQPRRDTEWSAERTNLPRPVQPGVTYRDIGIRLKIVSRFADIDRIVAEALGETPPTDDTSPPSNTPPNTNDAAPTNNSARAADNVRANADARTDAAPSSEFHTQRKQSSANSHAATLATNADGAQVATMRSASRRTTTQRRTGARAARRLR